MEYDTMALTNDDLNAIANLISQNLEPINNRFDIVENKLDKIENRLDKVENRLDVIELKQDRTSKKLDDLQINVKIAERDIRRDIHNLNDEMETVIEILKQHELIPR